MPPSLLERARLTGDWGGLRTALEDRGLDLGLANQGDLFGIVAGGVRRQAVYADLLEPTLAIDLDKLAGWGGARLFVRGIGTCGVDPIEATGSIHAPSSLASSVDTFALIEGWGELSFLDDTLAVLAGLYALDTEFDVKRTAGVFLNGGFGTGLDLSETGRNGPCIFPVSCLGVRIEVRPTRELSLKTAVLDGVAGDPDHPHGTRVRLDEEDGLLVAIEIGYERGGVGAGLFRAALGAWLYTGEFPDVLAVDDDGEPRVRHGTHGLYGLAEAGLFRKAGQRTRGLDAFLRAGMADSRVNQIAYSVSGGLVYTGLLPGRGEDVTGLGVSAGINGDRFRQARRRAGSPADGHEVALEWTYLARLLPWLRVQLDLQYIVNPGTDPARRAGSGAPVPDRRLTAERGEARPRGDGTTVPWKGARAVPGVDPGGRAAGGDAEVAAAAEAGVGRAAAVLENSPPAASASPARSAVPRFIEPGTTTS